MVTIFTLGDGGGTNKDYVELHFDHKEWAKVPCSSESITL